LQALRSQNGAFRCLQVKICDAQRKTREEIHLRRSWNRPGRFPLVIMLHGTPSEGDAFVSELAKRTPINFNTAAVALAQRGYATLAVMRRGFGLSGGGYSERLQTPCDYLPAVRVAADDIVAAIAAVRNAPWVDPDHILLLGHSTGGLAALAVAERNPSGIVGVLNFDGGYHASARPGEPCGPDHLWVYAENDPLYGPDLARQLLAAYTADGVRARLQILPPFGTDGHDLITRASAGTWLPTVEPFLAELGLPTAVVIDLPEPAQLPAPSGLLPVCQKVFANYSAYRSDAKAFAINDQGGCDSGVGRTAAEARESAIANCQSRRRGAICHLYAVGQRVVEN